MQDFNFEKKIKKNGTNFNQTLQTKQPIKRVAIEQIRTRSTVTAYSKIRPKNISLF